MTGHSEARLFLRTAAAAFLDRAYGLPGWRCLGKALGADLGGRNKVLLPLLRCVFLARRLSRAGPHSPADGCHP